MHKGLLLVFFSLFLIIFTLRHASAQSSYCESITINTNLPDSILFCDSANATLNAGSGFVTYLWSNGVTNQNNIIYFSGRYFVTVTNDSGCVAVDTVIVSLINTSVVSSDDTICQGSTVNADAIPNSTNTNSCIFDGINDYLSTNDNNLPDGNIERTFEAWIYNSGQTGRGYIFSYGDWNTGQPFALYIDSLNQLNLLLNQTIYTCNDLIPVDTMTHISVSTDIEHKFRFYINGTFINSGPVSGMYATSLNGTMNIGRSGNSSYQGYFNGIIDELRIWNKALSSPEILQYIYMHLNYSSSIYLIRYWDFNSQQSGAAYDINGSAAVISGAGLSTSVPFINYQYVYQWSSGQSFSSISLIPAQTTTYYLYASDGISACTYSLAITVVPAPDMPDTVSLCNTADYLFNAGNIYSNYLWNDGSTGATLTVNTSGNYSVTVTGSGCSYVKESLLEFIYVNITEEDTSICYGDGITLHGTSSTGNFLWTTGQTNPVVTFHPVATTMYYLYTSNQNNYCYDSVLIHVLYPININLQDSYFACNTTSIDINVPNPVYESYHWNNGATTSSVNVINSNSYIVTVTNSDGCTASDTTIVTILHVNILQEDTTICGANPVVLTVNTNGSNITWSNGMTGNPVTVSPLATDSFTATVSSGTNACADQVTITVEAPFYIILQDSIFSCLNESVVLDASSPNSTYHWSTGQTSSSIGVYNTGLYSVTVTNMLGCKATSQSFISLIYADITSSASNICPDSLISLNTNSNGFTYHWNTGDTVPVIFVTPNQSTIYFVTVTDGFGTCIYSEAIIVIPVNTGIIYGPFVVYADTTVTYNVTEHAGSTYQWFISGGTYTPTTTGTVTITWGFGETGYISVVETNINNCTGQPSELFIDIIFHETINELLPLCDFFISPNPFHNEAILTLPENDTQGIIRLYGITGVLIDEIPAKGNKKLKISQPGLAPGVYIVTYYGSDKRILKAISY